jgi:hypothetical protein
MERQIQIGDLVKHSGPLSSRLGVVINFDLEGEAVLCFMDGKDLWFRSNQLEVINASR